MARKATETHIFYVHGSDEIQIRSWYKGLNNAIRKLQQDEPQSVWIDESDDPGYLQAAVKVGHLTFRTVRSGTPAISDTKKKKRRRSDADSFSLLLIAQTESA